MAKVDVLKSYVPDLVSGSLVFAEIYATHGSELDDVSAAAADILSQCFIDSATWGLKNWETFLGIPIDESKQYDYRQSVIKSKIRGVGTVTVSLIKNVAESFSNGEVTIAEYNSESRFEIKFTGTLGTPPNMGDLSSAIEEIKPAHLSYSYVYIYRRHSQLSLYTHAQLSAYTHETLRSGVML
jgi:uncharacterized protein YmfQ (DUF2313 family)